MIAAVLKEAAAKVGDLARASVPILGSTDVEWRKNSLGNVIAAVDEAIGPRA